MTDKKIKFTKTEVQNLKAAETKVYLRSVMEKIYEGDWKDHLQKLLSGDRETLDFCVKHLSTNLDFFPLLHTLCLITRRKEDLEEKDPIKAADRWLTWYADVNTDLAWDTNEDAWLVPKKPRESE